MASTSKPKIFIFCVAAQGFGFGDVLGRALAEDGTVLASHVSSSESFAKYDMGARKHDAYAAKYPDGYELVWLSKSEMDTDFGFASALMLNRADE